jgi:hypothetical protein
MRSTAAGAFDFRSAAPPSLHCRRSRRDASERSAMSPCCDHSGLSPPACASVSSTMRATMTLTAVFGMNSVSRHACAPVGTEARRRSVGAKQGRELEFSRVVSAMASLDRSLLRSYRVAYFDQGILTRFCDPVLTRTGRTEFKAARRVLNRWIFV